jgi:hypothetical protein
VVVEGGEDIAGVALVGFRALTSEALALTAAVAMLERDNDEIAPVSARETLSDSLRASAVGRVVSHSCDVVACASWL